MCSDHDQWRIHAYEAGASASAGTSQHGVTQLWGGVRPPIPNYSGRVSKWAALLWRKKQGPSQAALWEAVGCPNVKSSGFEDLLAYHHPSQQR